MNLTGELEFALLATAISMGEGRRGKSFLSSGDV